MILHLRDRLRNALAASHPGEADYRLAVGKYGGFLVAYREGTADEKVIRHSFDNDIFFAAIKDYPLPSNGLVVDVGAHIGTFSLLAASKVFNGTVHAIEPARETFNYLFVNLSLNAASNIIPHRLALTDCDGEVTLHHGQENWSHSIMKRLSTNGEVVQAMRLKDFLELNGIGAVSLMRCNCEGAEFPILMTADLDSLRRVQTLLVLYHLDLVTGYSLEGLLERLRLAGFTLELRNQTAERGWIVARCS